MRAVPSLKRLSSMRGRRSRAGARIDLDGAFEGVDRRAHVSAAGRPHHHVPIVLVEQGHSALNLLGVRTGRPP